MEILNDGSFEKHLARYSLPLHDINGVLKPPTKGKFNAALFVENILEEGGKIRCDDSTDKFKTRDDNTPYFFDEKKFKRGQAFYQYHVKAMFLAKLMGLITGLAVPSLNNILQFTNMSSTPETAYKRYRATIDHVTLWYEKEFFPNSKSWNSVSSVKSMHNATSKQACSAGLIGITQKDMVLAQLGFVGFVVALPEWIGIFKSTTEDLEGIIHIWRNIGYLLGIDDKFNICRESVQETREICKLLFETVFKPEVKKMTPDYIKMASALINGLWSLVPLLNVQVLLYYSNKVLQTNEIIKLSYREKIYLWYLHYSINSLRYNYVRIIENVIFRNIKWVMHTFPVIAYLQFTVAKNISIDLRKIVILKVCIFSLVILFFLK